MIITNRSEYLRKVRRMPKKDVPRFEVITDKHIIRIIPTDGMLANSYELTQSLVKQLLVSSTENNVMIRKVFDDG